MLFLEVSRVGNRRVFHICMAEFTSADRCAIKMLFSAAVRNGLVALPLVMAVLRFCLKQSKSNGKSHQFR